MFVGSATSCTHDIIAALAIVALLMAVYWRSADVVAGPSRLARVCLTLLWRPSAVVGIHIRGKFVRLLWASIVVC
jgi:hypothetical protein